MNKEDERFINNVKKIIKQNYVDDEDDAIGIFIKLINLIQKQDKIIDMAMELIVRKVGSRIEICPDMNCSEGNRTCKQCAIEYFKKEVEKDVKD